MKFMVYFICYFSNFDYIFVDVGIVIFIRGNEVLFLIVLGCVVNWDLVRSRGRVVGFFLVDRVYSF